MSMWQDAFEVYQAAQSGEPLASSGQKSGGNSAKKSNAQQTVYVFAYLADSDGKTLRDMPVKDRLTLLELRQAELEVRCQELEARCRELEDYLDLPSND